MYTYILRRLLLIPATLFAIMLANFVIVQFTPGGPVEQMIAQLQGEGGDPTARFSGKKSEGELGQLKNKDPDNRREALYKGAQGLDPDYVKEIEKMFGFDQPPTTRFWNMLKSYLTFDFGESYFLGRKVTELIVEKLPVSISLGLWTTLLIYLISIPLGIAKAVRDGTPFDVWTSTLIILGYAIPSFLFAIFLIVIFAGGSFLDWFPLRGLYSSNWHELSTFGKIVDYFWHITLPVVAMVIGGFTTLTLLTKNSFMDEINKQYVLTAKAKGLTLKRVLYGHVFRNAMIIVIAGFPTAILEIFFTGSLLIEVIFSLDGLGLLGFEAIMKRDYAIVFATLYMFTLLGLVLNLVSDITYHIVDPRIDFESRGV